MKPLRFLVSRQRVLSFLIIFLAGLLLGGGLCYLLWPGDKDMILRVRATDVLPPHTPFKGTFVVWAIDTHEALLKIEELKRQQRLNLPSDIAHAKPGDDSCYGLIDWAAENLRREGQLPVKGGSGCIRLKGGVKLVTYSDKGYVWAEVVWPSTSDELRLDWRNAHYHSREMQRFAERVSGRE